MTEVHWYALEHWYASEPSNFGRARCEAPAYTRILGVEKRGYAVGVWLQIDPATARVPYCWVVTYRAVPDGDLVYVGTAGTGRQALHVFFDVAATRRARNDE